MRDQVVVSIEDLRSLAIRCRRCNTKVTLDLETEFGPPHSPFHVPRECPRCGDQFDSAIVPAVEHMQKVYKALSALGDAVTFCAAPAPVAPAPPKP